MRAAGNHIFLEPTDKPVSFLFIPEKAERRAREYRTGKVVAIGPKTTVVDVGNEVAYDKHMGIEVEVNKRKYVIIRPKWLQAVV